MRRKDREVKDEKEIKRILDSLKICRLGLSGKEGVYIVPLNYGYEYQDGRLTLYFHSAKLGKKIEMLKENPAVGFEMDGEGQLVEGEIPCSYTYRYASIIGNGKGEIVEDEEEKKEGLRILMEAQTGKKFQLEEFESKYVKAISVIKVAVDSFSCKENK
ncbi:nitroimidazol reductase NimA-like FMN-containing flavoprotein (pyridoxamine 5'-phosphate oxidase superfamily) [Aequitasia blattaphilus]|uniref:Pyridoxamine 5'-phosphate oxidase family protein n=1 Tax=Aequitasia blattaphilus TaxID=2949332 RepID=A0ABT1E913_9FIRM|nr:pyridoxamine 5'-phosphate oxidase family protein [Aequitasia blattaphilus]MCP1102308.1 pyridoxamine 5'-phosphate oxidase family protein [Aequitasia blattaphilus]MCR8614948.1 pyridoxamine 5'-phosphate oxidase family protein [Aequitasia blattaphilus]